MVTKLQTLLPHPNFACSAAVLDRARLGKQRLECSQIIRALMGDSVRGESPEDRSGWRSHPAVLMWRGHIPALALYMSCVIREWERRGYESNMTPPWGLEKTEGGPGLTHVPWADFHASDMMPGCADDIVMPEWLGDERIHASHRALLLQRDAGWYGQLGWTESPSEEGVVWPVMEN